MPVFHQLPGPSDEEVAGILEAVAQAVISELRAHRYLTEVMDVNLINNAYDAVFAREERWVKVVIDDRPHDLEIRVVDSGVGLTPALLERAFQPFFTTKDVGKGTGLGLSISKSIIEAHHGEISFDRAAPTTTVVVRLPKRQPRE